MEESPMASIIRYGVIVFVCITIIFPFLCFVLWDERTLVGWIMLGILILFVLLFAAWVVNEMILRHRRFQYKEETPLGLRQGSYPKEARSLMDRTDIAISVNRTMAKPGVRHSSLCVDLFSCTRVCFLLPVYCHAIPP